MLKIAICEDSEIELKLLKKLVKTLIKYKNCDCKIDGFSSGEELLLNFTEGK